MEARTDISGAWTKPSRVSAVPSELRLSAIEHRSRARPVRMNGGAEAKYFCRGGKNGVLGRYYQNERL